jgi:hypothetical protein
MSFKSDYTFLELSMEYRAIYSEIVLVQDQLRVVRQESLIDYYLIDQQLSQWRIHQSSKKKTANGKEFNGVKGVKHQNLVTYFQPYIATE